MKKWIFLVIVSLLSPLSLMSELNDQNIAEKSHHERYREYFRSTENLNYAQWLQKYKTFCEHELMLHKENIFIHRELVEYFECHLQMIQEIQLKLESEEQEDCEIIPFPSF